MGMNERRRDPAAEGEDVVPRTGTQQFLHDRAADHSADRITDHHETDGEAAPAVAG